MIQYYDVISVNDFADFINTVFLVDNCNKILRISSMIIRV